MVHAEPELENQQKLVAGQFELPEGIVLFFFPLEPADCPPGPADADSHRCCLLKLLGLGCVNGHLCVTACLCASRGISLL